MIGANLVGWVGNETRLRPLLHTLIDVEQPHPEIQCLGQADPKSPFAVQFFGADLPSRVPVPLFSILDIQAPYILQTIYIRKKGLRRAEDSLV